MTLNTANGTNLASIILTTKVENDRKVFQDLICGMNAYNRGGGSNLIWTCSII